MKKFKCTVTKTYEYEIEIDEKIWTEETIKEWASAFYRADNLQEVAEHLAMMKTRYDDGDFIEGFGVPMINGKEPFMFNSENKTSISKDININIIEDGDDYPEIESEEME